MPVPLYEVKAEFFRALGHPVRIRTLELLRDGPRAVHELLAEIPVEASRLSQHLAVLRQRGLVTAVREGGTTTYALRTPEVADLLAVARGILAEVLTDHATLLAELRAEHAS
ncbi:helix-turn-helix transcriptional regulator [Solihabitans fulvus]|uniref:Helix-turn-helix transcriptional regulator n=1 Tax=Solihabitans fulvus TaxID=1892852 RepID=A0A5B2WAE8_9PSEU|nr:metalloregulator ArsR/SmtB family transcription factor [Solihabitans fulvus]KAA2247317.1 helix-turn-helix transcriptional regulator [Solihabitans fulvus]